MSFWYQGQLAEAALRSVNTFPYRLADGFTIAVWARVLLIVDVFYVLFETATIGTYATARFQWENGYMSFFCRNGANQSTPVVLNATINVGDWWFLCGRAYSNYDARLYARNATTGVTYQNSISSAPLDTSTRPYTCFAGSRFYNPTARSYLVAHAAFWNTPIADADVERLAAGECPAHVRADALMVYYPLHNSGVCAAGRISSQMFMHTLTVPARWSADPTFVRRMRSTRAFPFGFEDSGPPPPPPVLLRPCIAWFAGA